MSLHFRVCANTAADKTAVISFLDAHWGEVHPLVHCEDFFRHYYVDDARGVLQFAFAEENGTLLALAGYIRANNTEAPDIWVSIWCAVKGKNGVGLELMAALPRLTGARVMACNNIRPKTMPFYTFLGYTAARVPHYYRLADQAHYAVAQVKNKHILPPCAPGTAQTALQPLTQAQLERDYVPNPACIPYKDVWYLTRRYFTYPRQQYRVYGAYENSRLAAVLAARVVPVNGICVLRLVDYVGKPETLATLGSALDALLHACGAEYADCYCYGIAPEVFAAAGFCARTPEDENIIPNYLTPLLPENTEYYCFTSDPASFTLWKADGDQDRPNVTAVEGAL